jgi:outer membrane protein assembly factor BamB
MNKIKNVVIILLPLVVALCSCQVRILSPQYKQSWQKKIVPAYSPDTKALHVSYTLPLIHDSLIILPEIADQQTTLTAYQLENGKQQWQTGINGRVEIFNNKLLVLGNYPYQHEYFLLNTENGQTLWKQSLRSIFEQQSTRYMFIHDLLFVYTSTNASNSLFPIAPTLVALSSEDGRIVYQKSFEGETGFEFGQLDETNAYLLFDKKLSWMNISSGTITQEFELSSLLELDPYMSHYADNNVIYLASAKGIQAIDANNGQYLWDRQGTLKVDDTTDTITLASPEILFVNDDFGILYFYHNSSILAFEHKSGAILWERKVVNKKSVCVYFAPFDNSRIPLLLHQDESKYLLAIHGQTNELIWRSDKKVSLDTLGSVVDETCILFDHLQQRIIGLDPLSGKVMFQVPASPPHPEYPYFRIHDQLLCFIDIDGVFRVISLKVP